MSVTPESREPSCHMGSSAARKRITRDPIFTIGHSTRTIPELVALLRQVDVDVLVDVRSIPRSRATPQFNLDVLPAALAPGGRLATNT